MHISPSAPARRSGLGIEAQRDALARFADSEGFEIIAEHVEVETGKGSNALDRRPELAAALAKARALRCPVAVAKLIFNNDGRSAALQCGVPYYTGLTKPSSIAVGGVTLRATA